MRNSRLVMCRLQWLPAARRGSTHGRDHLQTGRREYGEKRKRGLCGFASELMKFKQEN
ncbi:MAG: hypothetical protein KFF73_03955 [Cyclobacteriaceae bacterium]|nr:hypothetical protein [Cyclobacteriaceae bacterium]